jgi:hypothetical protein
MKKKEHTAFRGKIHMTDNTLHVICPAIVATAAVSVVVLIVASMVHIKRGIISSRCVVGII